jgi:hypothetical protein
VGVRIGEVGIPRLTWATPGELHGAHSQMYTDLFRDVVKEYLGNVICFAKLRKTIHLSARRISGGVRAATQ